MLQSPDHRLMLFTVNNYEITVLMQFTVNNYEITVLMQFTVNSQRSQFNAIILQ